MFYSLDDIPDDDFRTAGRFCARNVRLGVQTHPIGTLAIVIAAHLGQAPADITLIAFVPSLLTAIWRWFAARSILHAAAFTKRQWFYKIAIPALVANLIWALMASAMFLVEGLGSTSTLIMLGSVALSFGCVSSFAPLRILSLPLLVIHLGLPLLAVLMIASPERLILAVLLVAFLLYILRIANLAHLDYWNALQIRNGLTESRRQAEQASRAKDQFLANISHEIRTPLNGITAPVELLQQTPLNVDQRHYIDLISSSSHTLMQLIDDLLDFAKMEAGKLRLQPRPFAPQQLLHDLTERHRLAAERKNLPLYLRTTGLEEHGPLLGDALRIGQVIDNLLSNAVKFTASGRIDVDARAHVKGDMAQLVIDIVDTGDGIASELQPDIFKPFVQAEQAPSRRYSGTGLGLSICKRLTEQMHGDLTFASNDSGTRFTLQLQLPLGERAATDEADPILHSFAGLRVLVAEDNLVNQQVIQRQLALLDIIPDIVGDGLEALAATERNAYDLIILDCQMPELDGYECAARLRAMAATANIPIIALTANAMHNDMQRALDAGMSDYLSKPVAMATLSNTIARWIYGPA